MDLKKEILKLKEKRNAIILAHYYQNDNIQEIADYVGDSYYLSKIGKDSKADVIVFCGVRFMAEGAKVLSRDKTVLITNENALCPMAQMATPEGILQLKSKYPNAKVVCYVNSTTEVKAVSDVCCTSASALNIIKNIKEKDIIFVPDKNLGSYMQEQLQDKNIILWDGCCPVHDDVTVEQINIAKKKYGDDIEVLVHPECNKSVRDEASYIGSTSGIIQYATKSKCNKFLVVTEDGILYELKNKNPQKQFYSLNMCCENMKLTTLEDIYQCLLNNKGEIVLEKTISEKAYIALDNMHKLGNK